MNKNNIFIILLVAVILGGIGVYVAAQKGYGNQLKQTPSPSGETNMGGTMYEVTYTDAGFSPSLLTIKAGDTVTFVNNSSQAFWPASAMHPMHTSYPGSDIEKCGRPEAQSIFDACSAHMQDSSWSFKFMEKGKWNYHDHLSASKYGTVIVE